MEAESKNKIRTFEAVFDRKIRTSRLDFRKCSYKINGVYVICTEAAVCPACAPCRAPGFLGHHQLLRAGIFLETFFCLVSMCQKIEIW